MESWKRQQRQAERTDKQRGETQGETRAPVRGRLRRSGCEGEVGDMWGEWSVVVRGVGGSAIRPVLE